MKRPRDSPLVAEVVDGDAAVVETVVGVDGEQQQLPPQHGSTVAAASAPLIMPFSLQEQAVEEGEQDLQLQQEIEEATAQVVQEEEAQGDGEEEKVDEDEEEEEEEEEERPKLDDGFYEIEDIRKRRVVKGQLQYLIKWRGWPETANTWEPYDNIQSCVDIINSFEERSRTHPRKRKRKSTGLHTITKKKQRFPTITANSGKVVVDGKEAGGEPKTARNMEDATEENVVAANGIDVDDDDDEVREPRCTEESAAGNIAVHLRTSEEDGCTDALSNVKCSPPLQGGSHFTGARRRKSSRVKRFDPVEAQQGTAVGNGDGPRDRAEKGMEHVNSAGDEITKDKVDDGSTNPDSVAKILMPVEFSTSMSNNLQDVSVTFKALRFDGREVLVTNKSLKATNPQLLISFYEQHLRYGQS